MKQSKPEVHKAIGNRLKIFREHLGKTKAQMATLFGISSNFYRATERGLYRPSMKTLLIMSNTYGISLDWFFFDKAPMLKVVKEREERKIRELETERTTLLEKIKTLENERKGLLDEKEARGDNIHPEVTKMVIEMSSNPVLQYDLLSQFYRYKEKKEIK
ncbi:MAG: helix-turn-helix transcriptional regulator [bacterium]|nr:helix-turn-helix transcriptional regulator [bacterium]